MARLRKWAINAHEIVAVKCAHPFPDFQEHF